MPIMKITAEWSGFPGAPGYTNLYFMGGGGLITDAQQCADRVRRAFGHLVPLFPTNMNIQINSEVPVIDESTGMITDFRTVTPPTKIGGGGTGGYAGPTGAVVTWRTNDLKNGRRIRGRTFLVPLAGSAFEANGSLGGASLLPLRQFADELIGGDLDSEFVVWSRPVGGAGGVAATVTAATIPDMAAVLRSRRD